jgi:hypothetical protein
MTTTKSPKLVAAVALAAGKEAFRAKSKGSGVDEFGKVATPRRGKPGQVRLAANQYQLPDRRRADHLALRRVRRRDVRGVGGRRGHAGGELNDAGDAIDRRDAASGRLIGRTGLGGQRRAGPPDATDSLAALSRWAEAIASGL